jgi:YedE family putative selenium metabolism protein
MIRFFLGFFAMIGALVFLGCPWRAYLRLAGGDFNAVTGLAGLATGIYVGTLFIKKGFNLGRARASQSKMSGYLMPLMMIALMLLLVYDFSMLAFSPKGPGAMHAPIIISLMGGLLVGYFAQRSRFCTIGAIRDIFIIRNYHLFLGVAAFTLVAFGLNLAMGNFHPGFENQPIAHTDHLWNFLGMVLSGLAFVLAGGCPGRQIILAGEGNTDSGIFVLGMLLGAAVAHNFGLASTPKGIGEYGAVATLIGIGYTLLVGFVMTK